MEYQLQNINDQYRFRKSGNINPNHDIIMSHNYIDDLPDEDKKNRFKDILSASTIDNLSQDYISQGVKSLLLSDSDERFIMELGGNYK